MTGLRSTGATGIVAPMFMSRQSGALTRAFLCMLVAAAPAASGCRREPAPEPVPASPAAEPLVTMAVNADPPAAAPGGTVILMWRLQPAPGWHLYWSGRNDSGFAPGQKLELPSGWTAGPLQWPAPVRHVEPGDILDHIYEGELVLLQDVGLPADAPVGQTFDLRAGWEWLACRDSCVPGRDSLAVAVTVSAGEPPTTSPSPALAAARGRLPQNLPPGLVRTRWDGATLRVERAANDAAATGNMTFMPAQDSGELANLLHDGVGPALALRMVPHDGRVGPVRGLLVLEDGAGSSRAYLFDVPEVSLTASTVTDSPTGG